MAARNRAYTHRYDEAQPANHYSDHNPARQARARLRRVEEAARYRQHEYAALATGDGERAGPGIGDRQREVV
jgi:hypothetical protein